MKISVDISDQIKARFDKYAKEVNVQLTSAINIALDEFLRSKGR